MSLRSNPIVIRLRSIGRTLGINPLIARVIGDKTYEARFDEAFLAEIRDGDCVWDVGANRGIYTESIAGRVGTSGKVVAFEPSPANFPALKARCGARGNVQFMQMALGNSEGVARMALGADDLGATSRIMTSEAPAAASGSDAGLVEVPIRAGASVATSGQAPSPQVVKIDVEGHELNCLLGLEPLLRPNGVRVLGIEVHFGLLSARGEPDTPRRIESMLSKAGYTVRWVDASHIVATRAA